MAATPAVARSMSEPLAVRCDNAEARRGGSTGGSRPACSATGQSIPHASGRMSATTRPSPTRTGPVRPPRQRPTPAPRPPTAATKTRPSDSRPTSSTDHRPKHPGRADLRIPRRCMNTQHRGTFRLLAPDRLKARLRPMRGLKQFHSAARIAAGHAFVQNLRRGHYELATNVAEPATGRSAVKIAMGVNCAGRRGSGVSPRAVLCRFGRQLPSAHRAHNRTNVISKIHYRTGTLLGQCPLAGAFSYYFQPLRSSKRMTDSAANGTGRSRS